MIIEYEDLLGKPFKRGGNGDNGFDCYTLAREICKRAGINLPKKQTQTLAKSENVKNRSKIILSGAKEDYIKLDKPELYCIVTFRIKGPFVNHIGVMIDDFHFIHIMRKLSVTVAKIDHKYWSSKIEGYYRYANDNC